MAYSLENTSDLTALGNAIRTKSGGSATMTVAGMKTAVNSLKTGGSTYFRQIWNNSTNNLSSGTTTRVNVPSDLYKNKKKSFILVVYGCSNASGTPTYVGIIHHKGSDNSLTVFHSWGTTTTTSWYSNSQITITTGKTIYWRLNNTDGNHCLFILGAD